MSCLRTAHCASRLRSNSHAQQSDTQHAWGLLQVYEVWYLPR